MFGYLEIFLISVFALESLLKIVGMGFITEKGCYMRDCWNIIDFFVVIAGFSSFIGNTAKVSALRTIRILRPLRSINSVKGTFLFSLYLKEMKLLVKSLIKSLPDLGNVVVFLIFVIVLFGILGMQLFSGLNENRCRITPAPDENG